MKHTLVGICLITTLLFVYPPSLYAQNSFCTWMNTVDVGLYVHFSDQKSFNESFQIDKFNDSEDNIQKVDHIDCTNDPETPLPYSYNTPDDPWGIFEMDTTWGFCVDFYPVTNSGEIDTSAAGLNDPMADEDDFQAWASYYLMLRKS